MKSSRRNFNRALLALGAAAPLAPQAIAQDKETNSDFIDTQMKVMDVHVSDIRVKEIREFLQKNTTREIKALRAWPVKRDTPPALGLGVFDN